MAQEWDGGFPPPQGPAPKKKMSGGKKAVLWSAGAFTALIVVVVGTSAGGTPANTSGAPVSPLACPEPSNAPTPPADGSSVSWSYLTCSWEKLPGTASGATSTPSTNAPAPVVEKPKYPPQVEQARDKAQSYLEFMGFSRDGLIGQLSSPVADEFPKGVATEAVDSLNVDWNAQAVKKAESYLDFTSFSCSGLASQLSSSAADQFTKAQAKYGASQTKACK